MGGTGVVDRFLAIFVDFGADFGLMFDEIGPARYVKACQGAESERDHDAVPLLRAINVSDIDP